MLLDYLTLSVVIIIVSVMASVIMIILWKINRDVPGPSLWAVAGLLGVLSFSVQLMQPVIGAGNVIFVNNAAAFTLCLLVLEGILRFCGFGDAARRKSPLVALTAGLVLLTWLVRNDAALRFLVQDPVYVIILTLSAFFLLYRSQGPERWIHSFTATAFLLFALGVAFRWTLALRGGVDSDFCAHPLLGVIFLLAAVWTLGWTYGLSMAVNYRTQQELVASREEAVHELTERKEAEEALRTSEMRSKALIEAVPDMLFRYNQDGVYLDVQVNDEKLLHVNTRELYRNNALLGKSITDVLPSPVDAKLTDGISKALVNKSVVIQEYSYMIEDEEIYFEARLAPSGDNEVVSIVRDVTERIRHEKELTHISLHDQLTGLYNRRYFENEMERLDQSREHPIAVISADLDGLKLINDTLGHSEGDRYLQAGADLLKNALRESDVLARVGGDEFALLMPRTDRAAAELLVNRIRRKIDAYNIKQQWLPLSISLGPAVSESADYPLEETYRMADNNMYTDKLQQGKKARAEIVSSLLASLFERGNLAEGDRDQVQELSIRLGQTLKLPEDHLARLALFAQVYDLGKVGLPDSIIHSSMQNNAGNLSDAEREALHRHPESGYRIASSSPDLTDVAELILKHHENYDGSGYPLGLKEDAIPVECRILSITVAYSAMINPRPYAETLTHEEALAELKRCAGSQFDPELVKVFIEIL